MLSKRLSAIAHLVNDNSVVADIGSDHGLLPCFLVKSGISKKAYAIDNKKGPLKRAKENVKKYNLNNLVIPILADGLSEVAADVNTIVIAGMGFMTIKAMLQANLDQLKTINQVIIQSNTDVNLLRKWIMNNNFSLKDEVIVYENDQFYFIFDFNPNIFQNYDQQSWLISEILINKNDDLYYDYLQLSLNKLKEISKFKNDKQVQDEIIKITATIKRK